MNCWTRWPPAAAAAVPAPTPPRVVPPEPATPPPFVTDEPDADYARPTPPTAAAAHHNLNSPRDPSHPIIDRDKFGVKGAERLLAIVTVQATFRSFVSIGFSRGAIAGVASPLRYAATAPARYASGAWPRRRRVWVTLSIRST